jgi:hypothetical protein
MFSDEARAKLKKASSGLKGDDFERMSLQDRNEYIRNIDNVLIELLVTEPRAFSHEGWLELTKKANKIKKGK